jgi:uncharacterized protein with HEPN domain
MRRDALLVAEMIEAAEQAITLVGNLTVEQLQDDRVRREALLWNFTVLGEAATSVSPETKERFPDVQWRNPVRLRNRVVHAYWSVDYDVLHATAIDRLPPFVEQLRAVQDALDEPDEDLTTR